MRALADIELGITEHLEGDLAAPSGEIFATATDLVRLADELGVRYAWFAEHHAHVHRGHMPTPLLFAVYLAALTRNIALGTAVICLNQHRAIDVAEQVAVADILSGGRMAVGFGSGSTPTESALFDVPEMSEDERHARFADAIETIKRCWSGKAKRGLAPIDLLPKPSPDLAGHCWSAVNSVGAAKNAGRHQLNVIFSHLRTPAQYREYTAAYRAAGGRGLIAANRPLIVAESDHAAFDIGGDAIRKLWRRFQTEGKIDSNRREPESLAELSAHPLNFIIGGPSSVAEQISGLFAESPFDILNVEVSWDGLGAVHAQQTLRLLTREVMCLIRGGRRLGPDVVDEPPSSLAFTRHN